MSSAPNSPTRTTFEPKCFIDRKPEDFETLRLASKVDVNKCTIRIRPFQSEDTEQVRELLWIEMMVGPLSARAATLRASLTRPRSILLYVVFLFIVYDAKLSGPPLGISPYKGPYMPPPEYLVRRAFYRRLLGIALSTTIASLFVLHKYQLAKTFRDHVDPRKSSDLINISEYYDVSSAQEKKHGKKGGKPDEGGGIKSASGFWVAELLAQDNRKPTGHVVGCVGIDNKGDPHDPSVAELRRMTVHPALRRRGVGRRLVSQALYHASSFGIKKITLKTTGYEPSAVGIQVYESFGWKRVKRSFGASGSKWWLGLYWTHYSLELGEQFYDRVS